MLLKLDTNYYNSNKTKLITKQAVYLVISFILVVILNKLNLGILSNFISLLILLVSATFVSYILYLMLQPKLQLDTYIEYNTTNGVITPPLIYFYGLVRIPVNRLVFFQFYEMTYKTTDKEETTCIISLRVTPLLPSIKMAVTQETGRAFYKQYKDEIKRRGVEVIYEEVVI